MKLHKIFKPYLEFHLDLGFITLSTRIMRESWCQDVYDYIYLNWRFFKLSGSTRLYRPGYAKLTAK